MQLSAIRQKARHSLKAFIFEKAGLREILELRYRHRLEDAMGFRGQYAEHRRFQIALLKEQGLVATDRLLEIGCGPLTGGLPIISYLDPGNYVGVDIRNSVLDLSWEEVGRAGLSVKNPRLICSSSFGSRELGDEKFDFIFSFSVLFHLDERILSSYFATVQKRLKPDGVCLANINTSDESSTWLEFPFLRRTLESYREVAGAHELKVTSLGEIGDLGFCCAGAEQHNLMLSCRTR